MKKLIIPALAMAMLASCGGGSTQNGQGQSADSCSTAEIQPIAATELTESEVNEIYKQIPAKYKDKSRKFSKLEKNNDRSYSASKPRKNWEDSDYSESIDLLPMRDGGWKVVFGQSECWEGCGNEYHSFTYKDGQLTEDKELIFPMDDPDSFLVDEFLRYGNEDALESIRREAAEGAYYEFLLKGGDTLVCFFGPNGHESELWYAFRDAEYLWNGEKFERIPYKDSYADCLSIINNGSLGGLRIGSDLNKNIPTMKCHNDGDQYYTYSRNGEKMFTLHTGDDGKIDEILVVSKRFNQGDISIGDSISKVMKNVNAFMIPSGDEVYVSMTDFENDCWIGYNATGKDGIIESIRIYKNYLAEATATEYFYMQAMNLGGYSAFTTDPFNDYSWEALDDSPNVVRETRSSRYAEEYFEFVQVKKGYSRYGIMVYSTSFQGEDEEEGTYSRGVDVYKYDYRGATKVGNGISAETIAKQYNVTPQEVHFSIISVDGYITASIEETDYDNHYEINDNGEIIQK